MPSMPASTTGLTLAMQLALLSHCMSLKRRRLASKPDGYFVRTYSTTQTTTSWIASYGANLTAAATPTYKETDTFLACRTVSTASSAWTLYLQTGPDISPLESTGLSECIKTQIYLEPLPYIGA